MGSSHRTSTSVGLLEEECVNNEMDMEDYMYVKYAVVVCVLHALIITPFALFNTDVLYFYSCIE